MQHELCDVQHNRGAGENLNRQAANAGYYVVCVNKDQRDIDESLYMDWQKMKLPALFFNFDSAQMKSGVYGR